MIPPDDISILNVYARPQDAYRLLYDATIDLEEWVARQVAGRMIRSEALAFVGGLHADLPSRDLPLSRLQALQVRLGERRRARRRKVWPKVRRGRWWGAA